MIEKILFVLLILLSTAMLQGNDSNKPSKKKIVVLDAGHGGQDTGAVGENSKEKDIVLAITLKVGEYLQKNMPNVEVIYTRKTDVFIPLQERAQIANNNSADLFVSIHANSNPNRNPYGTETFALGLHKTKGNLEVAQKENSVIVLEEDYTEKYEGFDPNSPESYIIFSMLQSNYLLKSLEVAAFVQDEFREKANRKDRGVKQAGFLVLWQASMPSILIETGFISNKQEEDYLISKEGQEYLASAIYRAIKTYILKLETEEQSEKSIITQLKEGAAEPKGNDTPVTNSDTKELWFRVQVTSSSKQLKLDDTVFKNHKDVYEYFEKNMFKYTIGKYPLYNEAKEFYNKIKDEFPGAFIVAFNNNERIDLKEAVNLTN